ncbi:MAG TPA: DUF1559 domain-containing protein [Gemmataceae bacterium]|nr:DUF1559 domain-containing protein [Gemmataceae bacterium]
MTMTDFSPPPRVSGKAVVAGVLGLLSLVLLIVTGLPALLVGFLALREINQSDGRLGGRRLAVGGMVLGAFGTLVFVIWVGTVVLFQLREESNRVLCQNNLRVIGQAANLFYEEEKLYPAGTIPNNALPPDRRLSWLVSLLPLLPQEPGSKIHRPKATYDAINQNLAWDAPANAEAVNTPIRWFLCRSDLATPASHRPALTSYVGIAGVGADAPELPADSPRAGVFGYDRRTSRENITAGISHTMLATETAQDNGPWAAGGPATVRGVVPGQQPYIGFGRPFGGCHPGGLNVLFVDGHVEFIKDTIGARQFEALATLAADGASPP